MDWLKIKTKNDIIIYMKKSISTHNLISKEHEGKWVAFSPSYKEVIAYSDSLEKLNKMLGNKKAIIAKGLSGDVSYAF